MKVIVKEPSDKYGKLVEIENDLAVLQNMVGGYIEVVPLDNHLIICNEDGKYMNLEPNISYMFDIIVGTIIVCDRDGEEFTDVSLSMDEWKFLIDHDLRI